MDFQLTEEQRKLKALVRDLAEKEFAPKAAEWDETGEVDLADVAYPPAFVLLSTCSGPVSIIERLGSGAQKRRWLPALVRGEAFCALGMSEANAGSAASDVETTATRDG